MGQEDQATSHNVWHYLLEFAVILCGITVSFYLEKTRTTEVENELRTQSLRRISVNLEADAFEFQENMTVHELASTSCDWLFESKHRLAQAHQDTVGKHVCLCLDGQTLFVDNQEEYLGMRNSGMLQLIEDSTLVRLLQEKYSNHAYLERLDDHNNKLASEHRSLLFTHFEVADADAFDVDFVTFRRWNGQPLPPDFLEFTLDLSEWHMTYYWALEEQLQADSVLRLKLEEHLLN